MRDLSPYALGATLYMPATRQDILDVVLGRKLEGLRSLVVCLEDAVADIEIEDALANLTLLLRGIERHGGRPAHGPLVFVRPRDASMAARLNDWPLIAHVDGVVVPKLCLSSLDAWVRAVTHPHLLMMPTLETPDVFEPTAIIELREALLENLKARIIALRIGGNDLLGCLGLRRNPDTTIYQTPLGYVIPMLCGIMGAAGFSMTAPVCEQIQNPRLLKDELALDIAHGLVGKTAIHPTQVAIIHNALRVSMDDFNSAQAILSEDAPAVFAYNGAMCEPATHRKWARNMIERAYWHGIRHEKGKAVAQVVKPGLVEAVV